MDGVVEQASAPDVSTDGAAPDAASAAPEADAAAAAKPSGPHQAARTNKGAAGDKNVMVIRTQLQPVQQARAYQLELLDTAINDNVLVFLDTGAGKTLVAVLLIKVSTCVSLHDRLSHACQQRCS